MESSSNYDERYEFNAPKQFIDFSNFQDDDGDDSFFDCATSGRTKSMQNLCFDEVPADLMDTNAQDQAQMDTSQLKVPPQQQKDLPSKPDSPRNQLTEPCISDASISSTSTLQDDNANIPEPVAISSAITETAISSLVTVHTTVNSIPETMETNDPQHHTLPQSSESNEQITDYRPVTRSSRKGPLGTDGVFLEPPVRHSPRLAAIAKALIRSPRRSSPAGKGRRRSVSAAPGARRTRVAGCGTGLTVEERTHLAEFATLASTAAITRNKTGRAVLTKPVEFKFATDSRIKASAAPVASSVQAPTAADFSRSLRNNAKNSSASCKGPRGPTKPQPFKLTESKKSSDSTDHASSNKFVSLAEMNMKFHSQTPQRFRTKPKKEGDFQGLSGSNSNINSCGLTRPQSPSLSTRGRNRPLNHPTREEVEEKEMQEAIQNKFKSKPLNPKVFEPPKLNTVPTKEPTVPEPFDIKETKKEQQQQQQMMARIELMGELSESLASLPHGGVPPRMQRSCTRSQPFSFHNRDQYMLKRKQEKIDQIIAKEKEQAEFRAHPMPLFEGGPKGLPNKKLPSGTKLAPFDLQIDKRAETKKIVTDKELSERENREREQRQFHARAATVTLQKPFIPQRSDKPLTEIAGFDLNTEKRSEQRMEFDMVIKRKEDEILAMKRRLEDQQAAEEEARIAEERRLNVHKARPMPEFRAPVLAPCERQPTVPVSPKFATDDRLRSTHTRNNSVNTTFDTCTTGNSSN